MKLAAILVLFVGTSSALADNVLTILNLGDSQSINDTHRQLFSEYLASVGVVHEFVGDVQSEFAHQAFAGAKFTHMVNGRYVDRDRDGVPEWEAGLKDALDRFEPDIILFFGGFNDVTQGAVHWVKGNYDLVIDYAFEHNPNPAGRIIVSNLTDLDPNGRYADWRDEVVAFNTLIEADAEQRREEGQDIRIVDNYSDVSLSMLQDDGLHLRDEAYQIIGNNWRTGFPIAEAQAVPEPSAFLFLLVIVGISQGFRRYSGVAYE